MDPAAVERAYNPRARTRNFQDYFDRGEARSREALASLDGYLDVPYGPHEQQKMDIFRARGTSKAVLMFIHGGYWRALDKRPFSFLAPEFTRAGVTFANINYGLSPAVSLEEIVRHVLQAGAWLYRNASNFGGHPQRLYAAGHSAGGHLTAMLLAALWPVFARDLPQKVFQGGLAVSGVFDLRPLAGTPFLKPEVNFDLAVARRCSPVLLPPATDAKLWTAVGGDEPPGFAEQNAAMAKAWKRVHGGDVAMHGENHFSVIEKLADPSSPLFECALGMMGIA
ncbi:MAG: alpha/beta hydrolase [Burkholderiales bacterium]|nr:alpha/beta hydrolase [Burkholderiales bacterium]